MAKNATPPRQRLIRLLEAYGTRHERWPAEDRQLAKLAHGDDAELAAAEKNARELDGLIDRAHVPFPSEKLVGALLSIPARNAKVVRLWPFGAPWQRAAAAVFLLLTGLVAGRLTPMMPYDTAAEYDDFGAVVGNLVLGPELPDMEIK